MMELNSGLSEECKREVGSWGMPSFPYVNFRERWKEEQKRGIQESLKKSHVNLLLNQENSFLSLHKELHNIRDTQTRIVGMLDTISKEQVEIRKLITSSVIQSPLLRIRTLAPNETSGCIFEETESLGKKAMDIDEKSVLTTLSDSLPQSQQPINANGILKEQCQILLQYEEELARNRQKNEKKTVEVDKDSDSVTSSESEVHPQHPVGRDLREQCEILLRHEEDLARRRKRLRTVQKSDSI